MAAMTPPDKRQPAPPGDASSVLAAVSATLRQLSAWGCRGFECDPASLERMRAWMGPPARPAAGEDLAFIRADLGDCRRCGLSATRKSIVFGEGSAHARVVFVGEGPGFEEDKSGRPFVGAAGQLLTRIIAAMHLTREQVYICNVVKCRPPKNRNPEPEEIAACRPFLDRQLAVIKPEVICALGSFAARTLLDTTTPVSRLRGRFHEYHGVKVMPTYHPAYLLRNPERKKDVWQDVQKMMALLGIPLKP